VGSMTASAGHNSSSSSAVLCKCHMHC
jgi:hypothetical protein